MSRSRVRGPQCSLRSRAALRSIHWMCSKSPLGGRLELSRSAAFKKSGCAGPRGGMRQSWPGSKRD
jgi:hypothetical protein